MTILALEKTLRIKLRGKLLFAFLIAGVLPFILLGVASSILSDNALKKNITNRLSSDLMAMNQGLGNYLENLVKNITLQGGRNITSVEAAKSMVSTETKDLSFKLLSQRYGPHYQGFMKTYSDVSKIILIGTMIDKGEKIGKISFAVMSPKDSEQNKGADVVSDTDQFLKKLSGQYLRKEDQDPLTQAYFKVLDEKQTTTLDFQELGDEPPSLWIATPLLVEEGQIYNPPRMQREEGEDVPSDMVGVLIAQISPHDSISRILSRDEHIKSFLVGKNRAGQRIMRSQDDVLKMGSILPDYLNKILSQQGVVSYRDQKNAPYLIASAPLKWDGLDWEVFIRVDETAAFKDISNLRWLILIIGFLGFVFICIIALVTVTVITKPVNQVVENLKDIAEGEGDLTSRLKITSNDETGELARWFNLFLDKIQNIIKDITNNMGTLNTSSQHLAQLSGRMSSVANEMSTKSTMVAAAAEEVSINVNSVAASVEQASVNVGMVASSTEEMTSTIDEIAKNSEKARVIAAEVAANTQQVNDSAQGLGKVAQDIGKVTETITEISEQTNLLALNATIEAARAGEAGKGFAVVANEIKELARQTAEATLQIKAQIEGIQGSADDTIKEIENITRSISEVNEIVSAISASVEEQSVTTKEIAQNISQASSGISEVSNSSSQSSMIVSEIAKDIAGLNQFATDISEGSTEVDSNSKDLSALASQLNGLVGRFRV
ncbi:MAG: methyl-accepting chemotaxis protein [Deltaproteobacteria bacterium]|nr:methyl-accepting chemotaxis protein [Deltaproteobacteria bacterium]